MKAFTDIEQSRKLAEILPHESADMVWEQHGAEPYVTIKPWTTIGKSIGCHCLSCWSLAALLEVLPKICYPVKQDYPTYLTLGKPKDKWCALYWDATDMQDGEQTLADNPVDACVEMINKLHELKML